jgi:hypothetical protein
MNKFEWFVLGVFVGFMFPPFLVFLTKIIKEVKMLPHEWKNPNHRREQDEHAP